MQVVDRKDIEKRLLFYWSKIFSKSIKAGQEYSSLEKVISILITDYELTKLKTIEKYMTKWNIREENYSKVVLTDVMEIYIIELPKFEKYQEINKNKNLNSWVKFIKNPEVIDMSNKEIKKAKEVLEEISQDEREIYLAELLREKYIMDQKAIEGAGFDKGFDKGYDKGLENGVEIGRTEGIKQGRQQGVKEGLQKGIQDGKRNEKIQIAKNLLSQKVDLKIISKVTGLTLEELKKL